MIFIYVLCKSQFKKKSNSILVEFKILSRFEIRFKTKQKQSKSSNNIVSVSNEHGWARARATATKNVKIKQPKPMCAHTEIHKERGRDSYTFT